MMRIARLGVLGILGLLFCCSDVPPPLAMPDLGIDCRRLDEGEELFARGRVEGDMLCINISAGPGLFWLSANVLSFSGARLLNAEIRDSRIFYDLKFFLATPVDGGVFDRDMKMESRGSFVVAGQIEGLSRPGTHFECNLRRRFEFLIIESETVILDNYFPLP